MGRRRTVTALLGLLALVSAGACSAPGGAAQDRSAGGGARGGAAVVLAVTSEEDSLHPLMGYAEHGAGKLYDGLVARDADLRLRPALAASLPTTEDAVTWTVDLREGVTFHDGSAFDAEDVVATYRALLDPAAASPLAGSYSMLERVEAVDGDTVRFTLRHPYAPFPHKLALGIVPSERVEPGRPVAESPLGTEPVGTGPYRLAGWRRGQELVLEAFEEHWRGAPAVRRVTVVTVEDDNTRAQRLASGELDGTVLPPALADTFADEEGLRVMHVPSADWRAVVLPTGHPVTGDPAVRRALNLAVDRRAMVDALLAGHGEPAYTPLPQVLAEYADPAATFPHDPDAAATLLQEAGWLPGPDGVRRRDGQRAAFTLMYPAGDTVRRDLAAAFRHDAAAVGVEVELEGLGWDAIEPRMGRDAVVFAEGNPFDPDFATYQLMHSSFAADGFNNPGSYSNPAVDAALDRARRTTDPEERTAAYRAYQRAYVADPGFVFLAFLDHSYVLTDEWEGLEPVVEPHVHGLTWGPWWNLESWEPAG